MGKIKRYDTVNVIDTRDDSTELCEFLGPDQDDDSVVCVDIGSESVEFDSATGHAVAVEYGYLELEMEP